MVMTGPQGQCLWIFCTPLGSCWQIIFGGRGAAATWAGCTLEPSVLSSQRGFPLWSSSLYVQRRAFFFPIFFSPSLSFLFLLGMLMPPRCMGTVPQECPRCVLNFGPGSFNAWWQRERMLFGFMWNSPPFLFSVPKTAEPCSAAGPWVPRLQEPRSTRSALSPQHCQSSLWNPVENCRVRTGLPSIRFI